MSAVSKRVPSRRAWPWVLLAASVVIVVVVRVRLAGFPLERDEGEYAYVGGMMLQGVPPYVSAYGMKLPGAYAMYALAIALGGPTAVAIRFALLVANLTTAALVFAVGRRLAGSAAGAVAAAAYGLLSLSVSVMGFAAHATHFVALFAVAGLLALLRAEEDERPWLLAAAGALFGTAFVMKQHGAVFAAFGLYWLLRRGIRAPRRLAVYLAFAAAPLAVVIAAVAAAGALRTFWFWNVVYASAYARGSTLAEGLDNLAYQLGHMRSLAGFAALAAIGLAAPRFDPAARRLVPFAGALLAFSAVAVLPGLYFRDHYFIQMLPAAAFLVGAGVTALAARVDRGLAIAVFVVAAALAVGADAAHDFTSTPVAFCRAVYGSNPFPEAEEVARRVAALTRPGDRIAVLGSEPEIYFLSDRRAATGHIYMYGLMEEHPNALAMQKQLESEIEAAAPAAIVVVNVSLSWVKRAGSIDDMFRWAESYLAAHYELVATVDVVPPDEQVLIYRRKANAL